MWQPHLTRITCWLNSGLLRCTIFQVLHPLLPPCQTVSFPSFCLSFLICMVLYLCSHWLRMWNPSEVCIVRSSAIEALTDSSGHSVASLIMIVSGWPDIPILTVCVPNYVISSFCFNQLLTAEQQELFCMKVSIMFL